jgi:hypothetical protein
MDNYINKMSISNNIIDQLFSPKIIKILPNFLLKKLIKKKNIFFLKSHLKELPQINYPFSFSENDLENFLINIEKENHKLPFNEFPHLALLLKYVFQNKSSFSLLDYGAQFIDNYIFLKKKIPNIIYYYHDQKNNNLTIQNFIKKKKLRNIYIFENIKKKQSLKYDFVYFGSVTQYLKNYKEIFIEILLKKPKYVFLSGTNFYFKNKKEKIICKQLNVFPQINYCYFFNYDHFINFLKSKGYVVEYVSENLYGKLINYKSINKVIKDDCKYLDILFKLEKQ